MSNAHFAWYDLMSTDPEGAKAFYSAVAGWGLQSWDADPGYTMFTVDGAPVGGVRQLPPEAAEMGAPTHWLAYVTVADSDATAAKVEELGGKVLMKMAVPEVGSWAVFSDPQGAVIAAFTPAGEASGNPRDVPGYFSWHEVMTSDLEGCWSFYKEVFGWQLTSDMDMGPEMGIYRMYGNDKEVSLGGMMNWTQSPPAWLYYLQVEDLDATIAKVKELGGNLVNGPMEVPGGSHVAQCVDPQGGFFALHCG